MSSLPLFPNYLELRERSRISLRTWHVLRLLSVSVVLAVAALLIVSPEQGLRLFWGLIVPVLPLLFLVAPGLWRNICPLAAANQTPRLFRFSRELTAPAWLQEYNYVIGFSAFFVLASSRKWLFNHSGLATGLFVLAVLGLAFAGGVIFKGKSGWCSSVCPLLPVQRLYNQTPFALIGNSHCTPCVGCTKHCYDFNPGVANLADLYDDDPYYANYRKVFAGAFPGFILAFFTLPAPPTITIPAMYAGFGVFMAVSAGLFFLSDALIKVSTFKITTLFGAAALNLFYWFVIPGWLANVAALAGMNAPVWLVWLLRLGLLALTAVWVVRSYAREPLFIRQLMPETQTKISSGAAKALREAAGDDAVEITVMPQERRFLVEPDRTLLETAEANDVRIESGCRMGVCGADPIVILSGSEHLNEARADERSTLDRLGLGDNCRMACVARARGPVSFSLDLALAEQANIATDGDFVFDPSVQQVVIVGNGIAGVTAADYVRRYHPDCTIHLIGRERHHLYNRMAISRLIYGRSAMHGLYLQPETWYDQQRITTWLNTTVSTIDADTQTVTLATGESLPYDRLILATGSRSFVPPIEGYGLAGSYVLRQAEDAMALRAYVQERQARRAVVAGGGLLGLEAAYALFKLGLDVSVLERGDWLLRRQLDERGGALLQRYLETLGLDILLQSEAAAVSGDGAVEQVVLRDGRALPCQVFLVAAGIRSNVELAEDMATQVRRGVVVDDHMRTSAAQVFAAGDVCEYDGRVLGLWPIAVEQAKVAAINAVGGDRSYEPVVPITTLKVVGVELTSIGRFNAGSDEDVVIALEDSLEHRYRKLIICEGKIQGAILLGYPQLAPIITHVVNEGIDVSAWLPALEAGDWDVLDRA